MAKDTEKSAKTDKKSGTDTNLKKKKKKKKKSAVDQLGEMQREARAVDREELANKQVSDDDKRYFDEYLHIFDQLHEIIRRMEGKVKIMQSSRDIYALMALYQQQREVIADIRSITDYTEHASRIIEDVLVPLFNTLTQKTLDINFQMRKLIIEVAPEESTQKALRVLEDLTREQGRVMQDSLSSMTTDIVKCMSKG
jgi:hypothetical protein